jgi:hypothetical protein
MNSHPTRARCNKLHNANDHHNRFYPDNLSRLAALRFDYAIPCHATIDVDLASIYREMWVLCGRLGHGYRGRFSA